MAVVKTLLTGPHGAELRERLLGEVRQDPQALWIVPTPLAKTQVLASLGRRRGMGTVPRVCCWNDLWVAVLQSREDGPPVWSEAGTRAAFLAALGDAHRAGELRVGDAVYSGPGYRRSLRALVRLWTTQERSPDDACPQNDALALDAWSVFGRYRRALNSVGAEDAEGLATWSSRVVERAPPAFLRRPGLTTLNVLDLDCAEETPAVRRTLASLESRARSVRVTLAYDPAPALAEAYATGRPIRERLLPRGYVETSEGLRLFWPSGLREAVTRIFGSDGHRLPPLEDVQGLSLLGGPQGEGLALLVAREVREALESGCRPEDILVLVPRWDDDAESVWRVLRAWGLPVHSPARHRCLAEMPVVAAVRLALSIPVDGWEAEGLARLLRHGRFRPEWPGLRAPNLAVRAASALRESGVYRGREAVLKRMAGSVGASARTRSRLAPETYQLVEQLVESLGKLDRDGTWAEHTERLRQLTGELGFDRGGASGEGSLEPFWEALADYGEALAELGRHRERWELPTFAEAVAALTGDLAIPGEDYRPGSIVVTTVNEARGVRARVVVLANLAEGTFPSRSAVESTSDPDANTLAYARELSRFLGVLGSAEDRVVLAYPTRDAKGQEVLPAGFLEDLRRSYSPRAVEAMELRHNRFDPALINHGDLALAPGDARVRAVALACLEHDSRELRRLASLPVHREALAGVALALSVGHQRTNGSEFTPFEGRLIDPEAIQGVARRFGSGYAFSASQLESFLYCPFQFFMRYVLGLRPTEERDELDEDFVGRGNRVHLLLETLERRRAGEGIERTALAEAILAAEREAEYVESSEIDAGRRLIDLLRVERTVRRYLAQAVAYERRMESSQPEPRYFELSFGDPDRSDSLPALEVGSGDTAVKIRGTIDRVDVIVNAAEVQYRVIDYKTGKCPSQKEIQNLDRLQLPIYAMAAERVVLRDLGARQDEVGYWELSDRGYFKADVSWEQLLDRVEERILGAVDRLRAGQFLIQPRKDECTKRCDFASTCRINQVRRAGKTDAPEPQPS